MVLIEILQLVVEKHRAGNKLIDLVLEGAGRVVSL
jgi:hypothetical protein